ncbi:MAG: hypothetical protein CVV09_09025 [Gammaproteobacteria bacterium HGW-Gammaproteobacteria-13]|nr:MAG: hypothetical protein CVV09_09025 [Gammaproteobacteria bacterium HGW-Gammaproteobacteria-13]
MQFGWAHQAVPLYRCRQTRCWRFGLSISLGARATGCKNDRGIAESVKAGSQADMSQIKHVGGAGRRSALAAMLSRLKPLPQVTSRRHGGRQGNKKSLCPGVSGRGQGDP